MNAALIARIIGALFVVVGLALMWPPLGVLALGAALLIGGNEL